jgi:UDP-N-acetylglucosamine 2-epimerase (non-hydrolysing)
MPEEINRVLTDALAAIHLCHSPEARENLLREGASETSIHSVGNTMIDTVVAMRKRPEVLEAAARRGLSAREYVLVTLHRPELVDGPLLRATIEVLAEVAEHVGVVFPVHPRTRAALDGSHVDSGRVQFLAPLGYLDFLGLTMNAAGVLTDSGGVQEETTALRVPCFTLRTRTERPITVELGTNTVLGLAPERIRELPRLLAGARERPSTIPPLWDGKAAERVVDVFEEFLDARTG